LRAVICYTLRYENLEMDVFLVVCGCGIDLRDLADKLFLRDESKFHEWLLGFYQCGN
jgi:hypothetical protein